MSIPVRQHIRASLKDAIYTNLNIGMAESYFCAFMLALGIPGVIAGLGTIIPMFIGVCLQLLSIRSFFRRWSLRTRCIVFIGMQTLTLLPLILIGHLKVSNALLVIAVLGLYWGASLSAVPPWNRLMGNTIHGRFRLKFFSLRNQYAQASLVIGLIASGLILNAAEAKDMVVPCFMGIFAICFVFKLGSLRELSHHNDFCPIGPPEGRVRMRDFLKRLKGTDQGKLVLYLFFWYLTVNFSSPYFSPYMLKRLDYNYLEYMAMIAISYTGRVTAFRFLRTYAKPKHIGLMLFVSCVGISLTPVWWAVWQAYWWIFFIEFLSGCFWAGFELSTVLLYFEKIKDEERTSLLTYISFFNTLGMVIGTALGGLCLEFWPSSFDNYLGVFLISVVIRIFVACFAPTVQFKGLIPKQVTFARVFSAIAPFATMSRPLLTFARKKKKDLPKKD